LDTPPLKLLDAVKHSVEDKRFFLSEQLLNVGMIPMLTTSTGRKVSQRAAV